MSVELKSMIISLMEKMRETAAPAKRIIIPVSGGSDSALLFNLFNTIYPEKTIGVYIGNKLREIDWFKATGNLLVLNYDIFSLRMWSAEAYRWFLLLDYALEKNGWLIGSRTRTEEELGSYSLASRVATYLPLANIWKTDVMLMCKELGIPKSITDSSRKADPDCGRPQEMAEIQLEAIDYYLGRAFTSSDDINIKPEQCDYLASIIKYNKFKSTLPISHNID